MEALCSSLFAGVCTNGGGERNNCAVTDLANRLSDFIIPIEPVRVGW